MKLLRFGAPGQERPGLLDPQGRLRDLSAHVADIAGDALLPAALARLAALDPDALPLVAGKPRLGACVGRIGKMICVGLNYSDHAAESGMAVPAEPVLFMKATSAICGPDDDVEIPPGAEKVDWEVELGVVIGKPARYISKAQALEHVAGYCIVNDVSERAYQLERSGQWDKGKGCDTFGPTGPWLVTRDEVPDAQALALGLDIDGRKFQDGSTRTMVFDVP
ncbi:MAG TPA: fumarylacetoacetate hydrolase family protein, partial [Burkholderiaceae bacterium]|nr:fumarylacetoacetate hydrolase family protein [Burkholderiaceae bacterium]